MSYKENLGRVKGETGTSFVPELKEVVENGIRKMKIKWTPINEANVTTPVEADLLPYVYVPYYSGGDTITFSLERASQSSLEFNSIKGEKGDAGHLATKILSDETALPTGNDIDIDTIYVIDDSCYIWNQDTSDWVILENMIKFQDYYTKNETYGTYQANDTQSTTYSADMIDNKIGNVQSAIQQINNILNNGSINIPMDDD